MSTGQQGNGAFIGLLASNTILGSAMPMLIILGGLAGLMLAPSPTWATIPPSVQMLAGLMATGPFSLMMGRYGRRAGFVAGGVLAAAGGVIGAVALFQSSFILLCLGHMALGAALSCFQYFRFAAAEVVSDTWRPVAISLMLTSGLIAAFVGPQVFILAKDYFAQAPLAGGYASISLIALIGLIPLAFVRIARVQTDGGKKASLADTITLLRRGPVAQAVMIGAVSMGVMVLLMAPTPLAMVGHGHGEAMAGDVIRWHVVAMFAPSFFTGFIIKRFGTKPVVIAGLAMLVGAAAVAVTGLAAHHFYASLILLGAGWNFGFIGATNMLADAVSAEERSVTQGANDTIIALASTICAFGSGAIVAGFGWQALAGVAAAVIVVAMAVVMMAPRRVSA